VPERVVLDGSAGVEILNRTASGIQLARWLEAPHIEVWTVEHFHLEVAKVLRRYVLAGEFDDTEAGRRVRLPRFGGHLACGPMCPEWSVCVNNTEQ
jgi:hypothetical protein